MMYVKTPALRIAAPLCAALLTLGGCGGGKATTDTPTTSTATPDLGPIDRSKLPEPAASKTWAPPAVSHWTMANGIEVYHLQQNQAPLVALELIFPRGAALDPVDKAGLTHLTAAMLDEGAEGMNAFAISEAFQRLATDFSISVGTDATMVSMDMLADKVDESLGLMTKVMRTATFPEAEFARVKAQSRAQALAQEAQPGWGNTVVMRKVLFGEGYGAAPPTGTRASLGAITLDDIKGQYAKVFHPQGLAVVAVGAIDKAALEAALKNHFTDWPKGAEAPATTVESREVKRGIYFVDYPGAPQSALTVARRVDGFDAAIGPQGDYFPAMVFNWTLGGAFTSRVNMNLREDKGYTYGARSYFNRWSKAGFFMLTAQVKSETTRASVDEIFKELDGIHGPKPVTADEQKQAQGGLLLGFPGRFENMGSVAGQLSKLPMHSLPMDWFTSWSGKVEAVTSAQVKAMADRYTQAGDFSIFIAGDRKTVAPTLESLNLPIYYYDALGNPLPAEEKTAEGTEKTTP
ncbi:MAG: M16 family metallopeptidase [Bradymonadia bacterium]